MKNIIRITIPIALIAFSGCAGYGDTSSNTEVSKAIYPLGVDLNTLEGNVWSYNNVNSNGKHYDIQVKSIQNGFANFQDPQSKVEYVGLHTFGQDQLGYNSEGDLIGRTDNVEQVIIPEGDGSSTYSVTAGLFAGKTVSVSTHEGVRVVIIDGNRVELQKGLGITKVVAGQGNNMVSYSLENTVPDPPVHYGE